MRPRWMGALGLALSSVWTWALAGPQWLNATYSWWPEKAPKGDHVPDLVPFPFLKDNNPYLAHALRFASDREMRVDLGPVPAGNWAWAIGFEALKDGSISFEAIVQLTRAPKAKCAILSKWHTVDGGRSFELGVHPTRDLFFAISSNGNYDHGAREVKSDVKLRVGKPYHLLAVFDRGKSMSLYVNGHAAFDVRDRVPPHIHDNQTPILVGNRFGAERTCGFDGLVAFVSFVGTVLDAKWAKATAEHYKLTDPPEPPYPNQELQPVRAITKGPKSHWFTYYDRLQFDPTCRYVLGQEVDFEGRSPRPDDTIKIGMVDLRDGDRWIELGESRAWCWQQGPMLQWRPGSKSEIVWNDREGDRFVCRILDVFTRKLRTIPHPVYALSPDGRLSVAPDFRRIQDTRPGYGYAGLPDPHKDELAPAESGIWRTDLDTGESRLIISLADMLKIPYERGDMTQAKHWFNHLLFSPDGSRFIFLHRWSPKGEGGFTTRLLTATPEGKDIRVVDGFGQTSHFIWRDATHILAWAWHPSHKNAFYLYEDGTEAARHEPLGRMLHSASGWPPADKVEPVGLGVMTQNGHCSYLPGGEWILNDTYPSGAKREQHVYLYHVPTGQRLFIGHFHSPSAYGGEWRCDTHPRISPDGKLVCFDSPHGGSGRQMYLADISKLIADAPKATDAGK